MRLLLTTLLAGAALALAVQGADGATHSAVPNCLGKPVAAPSQVVLACADAGLGMRAIHWLGWGGALAAGVGTAYANDCTPTCAAGHFHDYRGVLLLSGSQNCDGRLAYRTATVAIVGEPPQAWSTAADATYPLRCA